MYVCKLFIIHIIRGTNNNYGPAFYIIFQLTLYVCMSLCCVLSFLCLIITSVLCHRDVGSRGGCQQRYRAGVRRRCKSLPRGAVKRRSYIVCSYIVEVVASMCVSINLT